MSVWAFLSSGFLWTLIPLPQVGVEPIATVVIAATADLAPQQSAQEADVFPVFWAKNIKIRLSSIFKAMWLTRGGDCDSSRVLLTPKRMLLTSLPQASHPTWVRVDDDGGMR